MCQMEPLSRRQMQEHGLVSRVLTVNLVSQPILAAPAHLVREASLRLPLKKNENTDPFKRSTSMRAYTNKERNNEVPAVKNWSEQLEAIKVPIFMCYGSKKNFRP